MAANPTIAERFILNMLGQLGINPAELQAQVNSFLETNKLILGELNAAKMAMGQIYSELQAVKTELQNERRVSAGRANGAGSAYADAGD